MGDGQEMFLMSVSCHSGPNGFISNWIAGVLICPNSRPLVMRLGHWVPARVVGDLGV
jgi:hypothetical protein